MEDLDKRLWWILDDVYSEGHRCCEQEGCDDSFHEGDEISTIKQAFADAGYHAVGDGSVVITDPGEIEIRHLHIFGTELMSGREWYDRFQEKLKPHPFSGLSTVDPLEAAKRASGIDE